MFYRLTFKAVTPNREAKDAEMYMDIKESLLYVATTSR